MKVEEIKSKSDLNNYLDTHNTVKNNLIGAVLDCCEQYFNSETDILNLLNKYEFFNKFDKVILSLFQKERNSLLELIIDDAIQKKDIKKVCFLEKLFIKREAEITKRLFSEQLKECDLFECLVVPDNVSGIRFEAYKLIKNHKLNQKRLLVFLNSINYILFRKSSLLINLWPEYLEEEYISNAVYENIKINDKKLLEIKNYLIQRFISHNKNKVNFLFLTDLIEKEEISFLKSINVNDSYLSWILFENEMKEMIPVTDVDDNSYWFLDEELHPFIMDVEEIVEKLTNTANSWEYERLFNLLKIKIHFYNQIGELEKLNFKQVLNEPLVAYYIKRLHDLGILVHVPKMAEVFNWPTLETVNRYIKKFDVDWNEQSPLTRLEYHVGISSPLSKKEREGILKYAFRKASNEELGDDWGLRGSPTRLKHIANHIAKQLKIFRRHRFRNMDVAISHWQEDLNYLKREFYNDTFVDEFVWPANIISRL